MRWNRIPYLMLGIDGVDRDRDIAPLRATLKLANQRLFESLDYDTYRGIILSLLKSDDQVEFRKAWKDMTMRIVYMAISQFPFPVPELQQPAMDLAMFVAEKFYDFMFSIEL